MFNRAGFWNSRPDGFGVVEVIRVAAGQQFVPLRRTVVNGVIAGPLATLTLQQTYSFTKAEGAQPLEAVYRFPLPGDAAVTGVTVQFGAVTITSELAEREQAEREYQEAQERGDQAVLTTRESPDVFTLKLTGLRPDEPIVITTSYVQLARPTATGWSLRLPLTTAARYVREDEQGSRAAAGQPLAVLRDPGHRFALDLELRGGGQISSPTHPLTVEETAEAVQRVRLAAGDVVPDRDCVLTWQLPQRAQHPTLTVLTHDDQAAQQRYFLALAAPPAQAVAGETAAREVTLLIDHSGSMTGAKWAAADWATRSFLGGLTERDTVALGLFHDTTLWFAPQPQPATAQTVEAATQFLLSHNDSGGTNLGVALEQALALPRTKGDRARHLLIITDAEVSDAARILQLADREGRQRQRRRISVLCIDAAPNAFLATELADRGGGVSRFLTSAPEEDDISTALDDVLSDWAAPVLTNLHLQVVAPAVALARGQATEASNGWCTVALGDLPAGRAHWVVGRVPLTAQPLALWLVADPDQQRPLAEATMHESGTLPGLKSLFGARRLVGLEHLMQAHYEAKELRQQLILLGYDPALVSTRGQGRLYHENRVDEATAALRKLLVAESPTYGLVSAETALVAVRHEAGARIAGTVIIGNALPAGWSDAFLPRPSSAVFCGRLVAG